VPLALDPYGTTFVVFRDVATIKSRPLPETKESVVAALDEPLNTNWTVSFQPGRGAPETAAFDRLASWSENRDPGIKYFSGSATYAKTVEILAETLTTGGRFWLDLGDVRELAEVAVNGKYLGIVWKSPYRIDVTETLKPGANQLVIQVTNLWVNRMIGDQQSWAPRKYTFTSFAPYKADSPLVPSGLLGPVRLLRQ
jgi:hypothetical protein